MNNNIAKKAENLLSKLSEIVNSREFLAKENTAKGGKNIKAHKIAYMVLYIFQKAVGILDMVFAQILASQQQTSVKQFKGA